jgi:hypothetical protein
LGTRFVKSGGAFQVARSLSNRNSDSFLSDFPKDEGIASFERFIKEMHQPGIPFEPSMSPGSGDGRYFRPSTSLRVDCGGLRRTQVT